MLSPNIEDPNPAVSLRTDPDQPDQFPSLDLPSPFGVIDGLDGDAFAEVAYEVFFTACRSSPGFGGKIVSYSTDEGYNGNGSPVKPPGVGMVATSRVKRALGLKMLRRPPSLSRRSNSCVSSPSSPIESDGSSPKLGATLPWPVGRLKRSMTAAEIMRQQMRVTEESDNRLRKALMRTLVGQMRRRAETIILPLELLRHLKPSEFKDAQEYHQWQKRQLKILKAGLLLHPSIPLDKSDSSAVKLMQIIDEAEAKAIDTGKNSETMRALCNCVVSLAWRSPDGGTTEVCHWADGYPLNAEIHLSLLHAVFDTQDETLVLDEVDELLELITETWSMLGINRLMHNVCFTWKLFEQYVMTGQVDSDLLGASLTMLTKVANDAKRLDRDPIYVKMLAAVLSEMQKWCERRLLDYHRYFDQATIGLMESILPLVFSVTKILENDIACHTILPQEMKRPFDDESKVDCYIRSSARNAFAKMVENHNPDKATDIEPQIDSEWLIQLARETEELASKETHIFSPVLKKWHPVAASVSAVTLHACYRVLLNQYLSGISDLTNETISVLQRAGKLEKALTQMVVEDSVECEDGAKAVVREMTPYNVDAVIVKLLKHRIKERLGMVKENLRRAKETETWNPKSRTEPYAQSAAELIHVIKESMESFFSIPVSISEISVNYLSDHLGSLLDNYVAFVASCGSKQSYLPTLPPLTRCSHDSRFLRLWKVAACSSGVNHPTRIKMVDERNHPQPLTSRGTQRLYIRLNTLHYLLSQLHILDKAISLSPKIARHRNHGRKQLGSSYFDRTCKAIQAACQLVSEVAAYRLIFSDSSSVFYGSLYIPDVASMRIRPALNILKQNITLLCAIITDCAQLLALKELMKATLEAYLMVLLAGGSSRIFSRLDHPMIKDDFENLKRLFYTYADGLIAENEIEGESEKVEGVLALMGQSTEQLVEELSNITCEASGNAGIPGAGQKLPIPPTTGQWNRSDPNTILRVLCHRNDRVANQFLKRTFRLAKRSLST